MGITVALSFSQSLFSQITVDFENVLNQVDTFWNASNGAPSYSSNGATFEINYDQNFMSWDGFAISSMRDDSTAGFGNQYSSYSGSGHGSDDYAVFFPGFGATRFIDFGGEVNFNGFYINNSSYAAISMRDGDQFAKQFGSPNDANGQPDGTNGEDWFLLSIFSVDDMGNRLDSTGFYLADFRFPNNQDDYIIDQWTYVDLSGLQSGSKLEFDFSSSDVGQFGVNTPTYFVMDDFSFDPVLSVTENQIQKLSLFPNPATTFFRIRGIDYDYLRIVDLNGKEVETISGMPHDISILKLDPGIYLVETFLGNMITARTRLVKE